jgi:hypothetical protein
MKYIIQISIIFYSIILLESCEKPLISDEKTTFVVIDSSKILYVDTIKSVFTWIAQNENQLTDGRLNLSNGYLVELNDSTMIAEYGISLMGSLMQVSMNSTYNNKLITIKIDNIIPISEVNYVKIDSTFYLEKPTHIFIGSFNIDDLSIKKSFPILFIKTDTSFMMQAKFSIDNESIKSPKKTTNYKFGYRIEGGSIN